MDRHSFANSQTDHVDAEAVIAEVLPLWSEQIRTARAQTEEAITAMSTRFSKLVERLRNAVDASRRAAGLSDSDGGKSAAERDERDVSAIVSTMQKALDENREVVKQVAGLVSMTRELENMVEVVKDVARQTDLIALNASIEAARAGEAGKSFAVVAGEVRRLSQESRKVGQIIGEKIGTIGATVGQSCDKIRYSAATIESALLGMSGMSQASLLLQQEGAGIHREICDMLVSLQFQDRVSQILGAVIGHLEELQSVLHERAELPPEDRPPLDLQGCLDSMTSRYTTAEQRQMHSNAEGEDSGDDLTFF